MIESMAAAHVLPACQCITTLPLSPAQVTMVLVTKNDPVACTQVQACQKPIAAAAKPGLPCTQAHGVLPAMTA